MEKRPGLVINRALNWLSVTHNRYIAAGGLCLGLLGVAAASGSNVSSEGQRYAETRIEVETRQGDVACYGNQTVGVTPGDTAIEIILDRTALVPDSVSRAVPDPEPVAVAVLKMNGINDPTQLPAPSILRNVPDYCAFQPVR